MTSISPRPVSFSAQSTRTAKAQTQSVQFGDMGWNDDVTLVISQAKMDRLREDVNSRQTQNMSDVIRHLETFVHSIGAEPLKGALQVVVSTMKEFNGRGTGMYT